MTIITGRECRSNQSKCIGLAHRSERVVISSKSGYAELTPVSKEDKEVKEHLNAKAFLAVSSRIREEVKEGKKLMFHNVDELRAHLATL